MRLHIVGLPWTETTRAFGTCAYTQKIVKAGKMLTDEGHDVFIYSGEENDAVCAEHVPLYTVAERESWFGAHDQNGLWQNITWDWNAVPWRRITARSVAAIGERAEPHDLLLQVAGLAQIPLSEALPGLLACEPFVGYKGIYTDRCAFESHAWRHHVYGLNNIHAGRNYDTVIPNYFDPDDFATAGRSPGGYCLFVGRMNFDKGPTIAAEVCKAAGRKLLLAGPGVSHVEKVDGGGERIHANGFVVEGDVEYLGVLGMAERARVMADADCLLAPTMYVEPFGGVAVEAMMCGTPAVTSNHGAFTETVSEGVSGYRFSTLAEGVQAVEKACGLSRNIIRSWAETHYSLKAVGPQFTRWFENLETLWGDGWYALPAKAA